MLIYLGFRLEGFVKWSDGRLGNVVIYGFRDRGVD